MKKFVNNLWRFLRAWPRSCPANFMAMICFVANGIQGFFGAPHHLRTSAFLLPLGTVLALFQLSLDLKKWIRWRVRAKRCDFAIELMRKAEGECRRAASFGEDYDNAVRQFELATETYYKAEKEFRDDLDRTGFSR